MKKLLLTIILTIPLIISGQTKLYESSKYDFIGYIDNKPIYYHSIVKDYKIYKRVLYKSFLESSSNIIIEEINEVKNRIVYVNNSIKVEFQYLGDEKNKASINLKSEELFCFKYNTLGIESKDMLFNYVLNSNIMVFPSTNEDKLHLNYISYIHLKHDSDIVSLPLIGNHIFMDENEEYLYFSSRMLCDNFSTMPLNVYRVKIGDWNNPELILEEVNDWFLIPDKEIIYARIYLGKEEKDKRILYNIETKSYAKIDNKHAQRAIKYEGKYYYESKERSEPIKFLPIEIPESFPYKDERIICGKNSKNIISNLPNSQKPFTGTFITEQLLYEAPEAELTKLTKEELRILRNAFYARQGYQFKSKDLQEFFNQFEWYPKMVERNNYLEITNEDVVIAPIDKERVDLIKEIESGKH